MNRDARQLELFRPKARIRNKSVSIPVRPRTPDEAAVAKRLESAMRGEDAKVTGPGLSQSAVRRLMAELPPITAPGWERHPWFGKPKGRRPVSR